MKTENFQLRGNNSACTGAFQLLRGRAPAQVRRNNDWCKPDLTLKRVKIYLQISAVRVK
jgi:hypothetical protein